MVGDILQPTHLLFVLIIALLVLGPKRLPEVARHLGSGIRDFKSAINGEDTGRSDDVDVRHQVTADTQPAPTFQPDPVAPQPATFEAASVAAAPQAAPTFDPDPSPPHLSPRRRSRPSPSRPRPSQWPSTNSRRRADPPCRAAEAARAPSPSHRAEPELQAEPEPEPEATQADAVLAEPEPNPQPAAEPETMQTAAVLSEPEQHPSPHDTAPDPAEPATTQLSSERPA